MILSRMAVAKPVLTTVIVVTMLVLGVFSYFRLVVDLYPEVEFPFVSVTTIYPGAGPEEVESQISKRIEAKLKNSFELDYPKDKLEIIVASDGSTDQTDAIVKNYEKNPAGIRVTLHRVEGRLGRWRGSKT